MTRSEPPTCDPFTIIVGRGRSGTTLLRAMFDSHPSLAIPPESHFLVTLDRSARAFRGRDRFSVERFSAVLIAHWGFRGWGLDEEAVRSTLAVAQPTTYAEAMRAIFERYATDRGKTRYGDKTPMNVLHMRKLASLFPEARFIHLIRDGRDVALSYRDADFGTTSIGESAVFWRRFVARGRRDGRRLGPTRYREVRYEDLVRDPEPVLRSLCSFVELPFDGAMLRYYERANDVMEGVDHRSQHRSVYLPPTPGLRDWRRDMAPDEVELFESIAGRLLAELGYERRTHAGSLLARARAASVWTGVQARRGASRLSVLSASGSRP
jgi:Sulfotransferase family